MNIPIGLFFTYLTYQNSKQINILEKDNNDIINKIKSLDDENTILFLRLKELFVKTQEIHATINSNKTKKGLNKSPFQF